MIPSERNEIENIKVFKFLSRKDVDELSNTEEFQVIGRNENNDMEETLPDENEEDVIALNLLNELNVVRKVHNM